MTNSFEFMCQQTPIDWSNGHFYKWLALVDHDWIEGKLLDNARKAFAIVAEKSTPKTVTAIKHKNMRLD